LVLRTPEQWDENFGSSIPARDAQASGARASCGGFGRVIALGGSSSPLLDVKNAGEAAIILASRSEIAIRKRESIKQDTTLQISSEELLYGV
jgi:hypothetical protein